MIAQQLKTSTGCSQTSREKKLAEISLKEVNSWQSQKKYRHLLANIPGLIYQFLLRKDGSLSFLFLSPSFQEFFEMESGEMEMETEDLISLIHPDDRQDFYQSIADAAEILQSWRWVGRFILPSGQTKWIQWDAQPTLQSNGNIFWNGLLVDVTSQYQLQSEVERLSFLLGLTELLQSSIDLYEIADFALHYLVKATNCAFGDVKVIQGIDETDRAYPLTNYISSEFVATYGEPVVAEMKAVLQRGIPKGQGLLWQVVETGQPVFIKDYANCPDAVPALLHGGIGQIGIFPIPATDGKVLGVLTLESRNFQQIQNVRQQDMLVAACRILGARIERVREQARLARTNAELEYTLQELKQTQTQLFHSEKWEPSRAA